MVDQALPRAVVLGACSAAFTAVIRLFCALKTTGVQQIQRSALVVILIGRF